MGDLSSLSHQGRVTGFVGLDEAETTNHHAHGVDLPRSL